MIAGELPAAMHTSRAPAFNSHSLTLLLLLLVPLPPCLKDILNAISGNLRLW